MFRAKVLIVRRSKLYYTVSGIITLKQVSGLKLLKEQKLLTELYFSNFSSFSNFRPLTCFGVMIPEAV
jgi:hypothetical protein